MKLHKPTIIHLSYWIAACAVGSLAVVYARFINIVQNIFINNFQIHPNISLIVIPFDFLLQSWWLRALICGCICSILAFFSNGTSAGSGYEVTRQFMDTPNGTLPITFPILKFFATIFSYLSGMAGGIFSPCLSIGSGLGFAIGELATFSNLKVCALFGMVAFFSGVVQAPLTSVIIVMEMTDEHILILPFMIAAFLAHGIGKFFMPIPLYRFLALKKGRIGKDQEWQNAHTR